MRVIYCPQEKALKLLKEIVCKEGLRLDGKTFYREAVRGIIAEGEKVLLVYSQKNGDYKFPGGGVNGNETYLQTLVREIREECGAQVAEVLGPYGKVIEYDLPEEPEYEVFKMASRYYLCQIEPGLGDQSLDPYEQDLGFQPVWVGLDQAIRANRAVLQSGREDIPRWTRRDTYVLEHLRRQGIQEAYNQWAATYDGDRNLTRDLDAQVTRAALAGLQVEHLLELGCGTGKNTPFLAQVGAQVTGVDFSPAMLARAQARLTSDNVSLARADLTGSWPFSPERFDLLTCNLVLEHIEDLDFIFSEAGRVLRPGGQFFICELHPFKQYQGAKANFQSQQESTRIEAFIHHISSFLDAAAAHGLALNTFKEWWHAEDEGKPPRLVSMVFKK